MSDSPSPFRHGQVVYDRRGREARYLGPSPNGAFHLVAPGYEAYDPNPDVGSYTDYQGLEEWPEVCHEPPVPKLNAEVAALNAQIEELRKAVRVVMDERAALDRQTVERKARLTQHEQLAQLDDYLAGKITHFVVLSRGYSAGKLTDVAVEPFKDAMEQERQPWTRNGVLKLLSLHGDAKGDLTWRINHYSDGSGSWTEVIPCTSLEQAQQIARRLYEEKLAAWRAEQISPPAKAVDSQAWSSYQLVKHAKDRGYPVPADALAHLEADMMAEAQESVQKARNALRRAEADLFARQMGQAIDSPATPRPPSAA